MEWILAILAVALACGACIVAYRSRAAARRLALEMIHLRDRLARAERHYRDRGGDTAGADAKVASGGDQALRAQLVELEERLLDVQARAAREAGPGEDATEADEGRGRILWHLRREGYERVAFLGEVGAGAWLLEAERDGVVTKARAEVAEDGAVRVRAVSSVRAFP